MMNLSANECWKTISIFKGLIKVTALSEFQNGKVYGFQFSDLIIGLFSFVFICTTVFIGLMTKEQKTVKPIPHDY